MLHLFSAVLLALSSDLIVPVGNQVQTPTTVAPEISRSPGDTFESARWKGGGSQFLAGFAGGAAGSAAGAMVGGLTGMFLGKAIYGDADNNKIVPDWEMVALLGGAIGAGSGGIYLTGLFVERTSSPDYPTLGKGPAMLGSFVGSIGGIILLAAVPAITDHEWGFLTGYTTVLACSSFGAVLVDRMSADPARITVAPWLPRPGLTGARASLVF
jgi:hypothetical protein